MKISKLFHWLYALVMLLPIFAIGVTSLISTFNMSAKEETEVTYKYQTNEVSSVDDLVEGNLYHFSIVNDSIDSYLHLNDAQYNFKFVNITNYDFSDYQFSLDEVIPDIFQIQGNMYIEFDVFDYTTNLFMYLTDSDDYFCSFVFSPLDDSSFILEGDFIFVDFYNPQIFDFSFITSSSYNLVESVETHNLDTQEIFYRAIDKVQESPLFNWAYNSFLVTPFAYIVNLFSMPTNSFVVMLLSYWLSISIIWLVFDLIMYIPLLVHRWLDKGVLE